MSVTKKLRFIFVFLFSMIMNINAFAVICTEESDKNCKLLSSITDLDFARKVGVYLGKIDGGNLKMATFLDVKATVKAFDSYPINLKLQSKNTIEKLKLELKKKKINKASALNIKLLLKKFDDDIFQVSKKEGNNVKSNYSKLLRQVNTLKYKKSSQWKRVEETFLIAKDILLQEIEKLKVERNIKGVMAKRLIDTKLLLPLSIETAQSLKSISDQKCQTQMLGAYYLYESNSITICAGLFNTFSTVDSLLFTIAHELAHSFDANSLSRHFYDESKLGKLMKDLYRSPSKSISCDKWLQYRTELLTQKRYQKDYLSPFDKFRSCTKLESNKISSQSLKEISNKYVALLYSDNNFKALIKNYSPQNKAIYLNQLLEKSYGVNFKGETAPHFDNFLDHLYIYNQNKSCGFTKHLLKESVMMTANLKFHYFSYCKEDCHEIVKISNNDESREHYADVMASKVLSSYLERERRRNSSLNLVLKTTAIFCPKEVSGKKYLSALKTMIFEDMPKATHIASKMRRHGIFTEDLSKTVGCSNKKRKNNYYNCSL